jgi:hypothetical protein
MVMVAPGTKSNGTSFNAEDAEEYAKVAEEGSQV